MFPRSASLALSDRSLYRSRDRAGNERRSQGNTHSLSVIVGAVTRPAEGSRTMKAAVAYEVGRPLVVEDLELPVVGPRDVLVRLTASGICHTDLTVIDGLSALPLPMVPGHEGCGIVEEVGAEVRRVSVGDRVLASVSPACGTCWWCVNGMSNHCELKSVVSSQPRFELSDGRRGAGVVRLRHLRRGDGGSRGLRGRRRDRPRRRATRAPGLRRHDGPRRRADHGRGHGGIERRRRRVRRGRTVGGPGCPNRRRRHDHRHRSDAIAARRQPRRSVPPTPSIPPRATSSGRCGRSRRAGAPTTASRRSVDRS